MFNLKTAALGAAFVGSSILFASEQAQAFSIGDTLNITGEATFGNEISPPTDEIDFENPGTVVGSSDGAFAGYIETNAVVKDLILTQVAGTEYSAVVEDGNPFVTLTGNTPGAADDIFFNIDDPFTVSREVASFGPFGSGGVAYTFPEFTGTFVSATGEELGVGFLTVNQFNSDGSYSMTIEVAPVPEPLTILGAGAAIGFGGAFKRKLGKKDKKGSTKA